MVWLGLGGGPEGTGSSACGQGHQLLPPAARACGFSINVNMVF